jgi:hypothetical protein
LHDQGLKRLYQRAKAGDPMDFIRGNEIYNHLESTVDRLEPSPAGWIGPVPLSCACWQTGAGPPGRRETAVLWPRLLGMQSVKTDQERRSKWREASAAGVFLGTIILLLIGIGFLAVLNGWPIFSAPTLEPASIPVATG